MSCSRFEDLLSTHSMQKHPAKRLSLIPILILTLLAGEPLISAAEPDQPTQTNGSGWERSAVSVEVARKQYDFGQPWVRRTKRVQKTGVVVGEREVLTTAEELFDRTLVRLQKGGRGRWYPGEVLWIDYHANLALVTTTEASFWNDLVPAAFGTAVPADGNLQVLRWRDGNLESRRGEFTRFTVREGQLSPINQVTMELSSEIQGGGLSELVVGNSHFLGLVTDQDGRNCSVEPASFIRTILEARKKGEFHGLGYFHFYWQPGSNPSSLEFLKEAGDPRGVIV